MAREAKGARTKRAAEVFELRAEEYPDAHCALEHRDAYQLGVATILSAQTTDERVNMVTPGLFALASTPHEMAGVSVGEILEEIRTVGLAPTKAKNIAALSQQLLDLHGGSVPASFAALEALPGVGHKTASVVMTQAFGHPAFPVDTHIHRLAQRWGLTKGKNVTHTETDLKALFPKERWNHLHLQIIYYGRKHCSARGCNGTVCEICRTCYPKRQKAVVTKKA